MRVALITNIPAPYRLPVFERVAGQLGDDFIVIFCARIEPNRQWDLGPLSFRHLYLKERFVCYRGGYVHNNPDVIKELRRFRPDVVITTGFNPTSLYAWGYSMCRRISHVPMTDGWAGSELKLGRGHRFIRRLVFWTSDAFIGAGKKSLEMYRMYGILDANLFRSPLSVENPRFQLGADSADRPYDLMYAGQIIDRKLPMFFADVAVRIRRIRGATRVLVIGEGSMRDQMMDRLAEGGIEVEYPGFVTQKDLPGYYRRAKLLLFPTANDPWGIVANEALASGTPVITTPHSGVAHDLVVDGRNGLVLDADVEAWASKVCALLENEKLLAEMRKIAIHSVENFDIDKAARGIIEAARWAARKGNSRMADCRQ